LDRTTAVGNIIDGYLTSKLEFDDAAIHLLFSANRWEKRDAMIDAIIAGTTLVVDRYSYSGVAFSAAKGLDLKWCMAPEVNAQLN
jgi:dTMP kinase